jgi:hypothetical protein
VARLSVWRLPVRLARLWRLPLRRLWLLLAVGSVPRLLKDAIRPPEHIKTQISAEHFRLKKPAIFI